MYYSLERWCKHTLDNSDQFNSDYEEAVRELEEVCQRLQEHGSGCHNNPLYDCACEGISATEFTFGVLEHMNTMYDKKKQSVMTQVIVDYLEQMNREEMELIDIQQDTQRRLERLQNKMRDIYQESERQGYAEIVDLITLDKEEE